MKRLALLLLFPSMMLAAPLTLQDPVFLAAGSSGVEAKLTLTSGMLSSTGMGAFNAAALVDGDIAASAGFWTNTGAECWLLFDLGTTRTVTRARAHAMGGDNTLIFKVQYSDNGTDFVDAALNFSVGTNQEIWKEITWTAVGSHRYWRWLKTTDGQGGWYNEVELHGY